MKMKKRENIKVTIDEHFGIEKALKKFKRMCESFGVVREYKRRQSYMKPSMQNKEKRDSSEKRRHKTAIKSRNNNGRI